MLHRYERKRLTEAVYTLSNAIYALTLNSTLAPNHFKVSACYSCIVHFVLNWCLANLTYSR